MGNLSVFFAVLLSCSALIHCCDIDYYAVGCYKDDDKRPLPEQLLNERDPTSIVYNGHRIDWENWNHYMKELACRCAEATRSKGYTVFGLQFYGECWSGPDGDSYKSVGGAPYNRCIGNDYNNCTHSCSHCVGVHNTNFVYKLGERDYY